MMDLRDMTYKIATSTPLEVLGEYQELLEKVEQKLKKLVNDGKIKKKHMEEVRDLVFNSFVRVAEIQENFTFYQTYNALCAVLGSLIGTEYKK